MTYNRYKREYRGVLPLRHGICIIVHGRVYVLIRTRNLIIARVIVKTVVIPFSVVIGYKGDFPLVRITFAAFSGEGVVTL